MSYTEQRRLVEEPTKNFLKSEPTKSDGGLWKFTQRTLQNSRGEYPTRRKPRSSRVYPDQESEHRKTQSRSTESPTEARGKTHGDLTKESEREGVRQRSVGIAALNFWIPDLERGGLCRFLSVVPDAAFVPDTDQSLIRHC